MRITDQLNALKLGEEIKVGIINHEIIISRCEAIMKFEPTDTAFKFAYQNSYVIVDGNEFSDTDVIETIRKLRASHIAMVKQDFFDFDRTNADLKCFGNPLLDRNN